MMRADKRCRKLKMGDKQWSPDYQAAREKVKLWKMVVKKITGKKVSERCLYRQMVKCSEPDAMRLGVEEATERRNRAFRAEKILAKVTVAMRKSWLESLCEARAGSGKTSAEQELRK